MIELFDNLLKERYYVETLDNGLKVVIIHKPSYLNTTCSFGTKFGSLKIHEIVDGKTYNFNPGIAHFLEHKLFETEGKDIISKFYELGSDVNAFTSYDETVYYFSKNNENVKDDINLLLDFVQEFDISYESVEKEKGIIIEELNQYKHDPITRLLCETLSALYVNYPLKYDIGGDEKSVKAITLDELNECYRINYSPANMVFACVSGLDPEYIMSIIRDNQSKKIFDNISYPIINNEKEPLNVNEEYKEIEMDIQESLCSYSFKFKQVFDSEDDAKYKELCIDMLLECIFSELNPMYQKWIDSKLITDFFSYDISFSKEHSNIIFISEKDPKVLKDLIDSNFSLDLLSKDSISIIKKRLIGSYLRSFNNPEHICINYIRDELKGNNNFNFLKIVEKISVDDIKKAFNSLDFNNSSIVHIIPLKK